MNDLHELLKFDLAHLNDENRSSLTVNAVEAVRQKSLDTVILGEFHFLHASIYLITYHHRVDFVALSPFEM